MIDLKLITVCLSTAIDAESKTLSLFNIMDSITTPALPANTPEFRLVIILQRDNKFPDSAPFDLSLHFDDKLIGTQETVIEFRDKKRAQVVITFPPFQISLVGTLRFSLGYKGKVLGYHELDVIHNAPKSIQEPKSRRGKAKQRT